MPRHDFKDLHNSIAPQNKRSGELVGIILALNTINLQEDHPDVPVGIYADNLSRHSVRGGARGRDLVNFNSKTSSSYTVNSTGPSAFTGYRPMKELQGTKPLIKKPKSRPARVSCCLRINQQCKIYCPPHLCRVQIHGAGKMGYAMGDPYT